MEFLSPGLFVFIILVGTTLFSSVRVLNEYERGVVLRLGRYVGVRGPGLILLLPYVERMLKISLRTITMDVPSQDVITKDNVSVKVSAVVYFRVMSPEKTILQVEDYFFATSQLSQTTLRSVLGQMHLDELLSNRDEINQRLQTILDLHTGPWGIKVTMVEVKQIDLPENLQRAMAKGAEAERERRATVISADGEVQRASRLAEAAETLQKSPMSLQLAYLQALNQIAGNKTNTIVFPLPLDLVRPFFEGTKPLSGAEVKTPPTLST